MTRRLIAAMLLLSLGGCGSATTSGASTTPNRAMEVTMGVIILQDSAAQMYGELGLDAPTGFWTPERGQVAALEASVGEYLSTSSPEGSRLRRGLEGYRAQYIGILRGDRELIFANFFCNDFDRDIATQLVVVDDGGDCFFTVVYDPASDSFDDLAINGEA